MFKKILSKQQELRPLQIAFLPLNTCLHIPSLSSDG